MHIRPLLRPSLLGLALMLASAGWPAHRAAAGPAPAGREVFLFSFFRDNGQDGLFLAWSPDGLKWTELAAPGRSFLRPELGDRLMRDPCLRRASDGTFHLVWTTGWGDRIVGYARSRNLVDWSPQKAIPVMTHEPEARNAWAPELFHDEARNRWLVFWATTVPGRFTATEGTGDERWNHRIYCTSTPDFETFSPTKLLYDGGFNVIDATLTEFRGRYHLIVKDETRTPVRKHLRFAVGDRPEGPFGPASDPFTIAWVEGPSAVRVGSETLVYFDHYTQPQHYGAVKTADFRTWEEVTRSLAFPPGARHGTVLQVPERVLEKLR